MLKPALCCLPLLAASQALACFTVISPRGQVVYHSIDPPVDMSRPLHETLPHVFPGAHMVFDLNTDCPRAIALPRPAVAAVVPRQESAVVRVLSGPGQAVAAETVHQEVPTAALVADLGPRAGERSSQ